MPFKSFYNRENLNEHFKFHYLFSRQLILFNAYYKNSAALSKVRVFKNYLYYNAEPAKIKTVLINYVDLIGENMIEIQTMLEITTLNT